MFASRCAAGNETTPPWDFRRGRKLITVPTTGRLLLTDVGTILGTCLAGVGVAQIKALGFNSCWTTAN